ncbi:Mrp/NBP35 family ATP-binding protein [Methylovirgula sp. 4M-Z18]|uniref:Mrp/NBP35 family ATP-binding protein n=1 Tax=Methylovirgula sp. 4M-Z18 TaxID=2293567 RepID=UPI001FE14A77|nr:Mrp/NBP35 family ATP-binding protein [Methylovirgula sp. 4M-Z18]
MLPTEKDVLRALTLVPGPDGKTPLPASGTLNGISIRDGKVFAAIAIDPAKSMEMEEMRLKAERAIKAIPGVTGALVTLTSERPQAPEPARHGPRGGSPVPGIAKIIAVASGKGGVGKSTTACNLALALAGQGLRVGILDADVYGPSMPRLFGLHQKPQVGPDKMMIPLEAHGVKIMSIGFMVEEETAMIWRGPMIKSALTEMLRRVSWGEIDVLVVDMPPGTGDAQLSLAQDVPLAGAVIVSTPQDLALIDARRAVTMFRRVEVPILGVVENMSYFLCPHCGTRSDVFAHGGARHEAEKLDVPFLGEVPLALAIRERSDAGQPVVVSEPNGPHAAVYRGIAQAVAGALQGYQGRPAPRIVIE